jgi:small subunit ribosomal protein S7
MPRRARYTKREIPPDPRYNSKLVQRFINKIMLNGKKSLAERLMYETFDLLQERTRRDPLEIFEQAVRNATPLIEVKPRRIGGATYQVPVEIKGDRRIALAIRWLIRSARARSGRSFPEKLSSELLDASQGQGATIKRREDTHKMAEANRAFAHYRW